jgi:hypothetical protein
MEKKIMNKKTKHQNFNVIIKIFYFLTIIQNITSKIFTVNTINDLISKIKESSQGDTITISNGTYKDAKFSIDNNGLIIQAETLGNVFFTGASQFAIKGNYNKISGIQFKEGSLPPKSGPTIDVSGNNNLITEFNWSGFSAEKYIVFKEGTQYNTVSFCNMENKPADAPIGCLIQILPIEGVPNYHKISHCTFKNLPGKGGDYGNEPIRIGLGALSNFPSRSIVEFCLFYNTGLGDSESISIKSMENVIRYNVFDKNVGGMLVFRNGNKNIAYSNIFIRGSGGIRVKEANDILCFNNYFEGSNASINDNAIAFDYLSPNLKNINFIFNTIIDWSIDFGDLLISPKKDTNINFSNNIFYKKNSGKLFLTTSKPNTSTNTNDLKFTNIVQFEGNLFETSDSSVLAEENFLKEKSNILNKKIQFISKEDGYLSLTEKSPAIDSATKNIPTLLTIVGIDNYIGIEEDINKTKRPINANNNADIGSEEFSLVNSSTNIGLKYLNELRGPSYIKNEKIKIGKNVNSIYYYYYYY